MLVNVTFSSLEENPTLQQLKMMFVVETEQTAESDFSTNIHKKLESGLL